MEAAIDEAGNTQLQFGDVDVVNIDTMSPGKKASCLDRTGGSS